MKLLPAYSLLFIILFTSCITEHRADLSLKTAEYQDEIVGTWQIKEQTCSDLDVIFQGMIQFSSDETFEGDISEGTYWVFEDLSNEAGINLYVQESGLNVEYSLRIIELTEEELVLYFLLPDDEAFCVWEFQRM